MKTPYGDVMPLQQLLLLFNYFIISNPINIVGMIVKCGFMSNDKIRIQFCSFLNYPDRRKHGGDNTRYLLAGAPTFYRIYGILKRSSGYFLQNNINDVLH